MFGHVLTYGSRARHQQRGAGLDHHTGRDAVDLPQFRFAHANPFRRVGGLQGGGCLPCGPARQLTAGIGAQIGLEHGGVVPWKQDLRRAGGQDHGPVGRGVECPEVFQLYLGQLCGQCHVDVARDQHGLEVGVVLDHRQHGDEIARCRDNVLHGLQLGYVEPGLGRHVQVRITRSQAGALVFVDRALHAAFAPVVGRQRQMPVAEHAVQLLQVVQCRAGGCQHVAAVVAKRVLLEFEVFAGSRHELPHAGRLGARYRLRIEGAFDKRQQGQLGRHIAPLQLLDDVKQVLARTLGHAQDVLGPGGIPLLALMHQVAVEVGHAKAAPDPVPKIGRRCQLGYCPGRGLVGSQRLERAARDQGNPA